MDFFTALQSADDGENIVRARVARRAEHAHEAFRGFGCRGGQFFKTDGRVDIITVVTSPDKKFSMLSLNNARLKAGSRAARALTVSLKSRVNVIVQFLVSVFYIPAIGFWRSYSQSS